MPVAFKAARIVGKEDECRFKDPQDEKGDYITKNKRNEYSEHSFGDARLGHR